MTARDTSVIPTTQTKGNSVLCGGQVYPTFSVREILGEEITNKKRKVTRTERSKEEN